MEFSSTSSSSSSSSSSDDEDRRRPLHHRTRHVGYAADIMNTATVGGTNKNASRRSSVTNHTHGRSEATPTEFMAETLRRVAATSRRRQRQQQQQQHQEDASSVRHYSPQQQQQSLHRPHQEDMVDTMMRGLSGEGPADSNDRRRQFPKDDDECYRPAFDGEDDSDRQLSRSEEGRSVHNNNNNNNNSSVNMATWAGESITERGDDDFLMASNSMNDRSSRRRVLFVLDDDDDDGNNNNNNSKRDMMKDGSSRSHNSQRGGRNFHLIMSKLNEGEEGSSYHDDDDDDDTSSAFDDAHDFKATLDYRDEDDMSDSIFDDPSVICEAERQEAQIKQSLMFVACVAALTKIISKIMECLCSGGNVQEEIVGNVAEDFTNASTSHGGVMAGGVQSSGAAQAQ